ncbi:hypothetical protein Tco_0779414 [Tanacetum coccineum]
MQSNKVFSNVWQRGIEQICFHDSVNNQIGSAVSYDELSDSLVQFEPHVLASRAKKPAKNHDPLALIAHSNDSSSHSHANSSYSPQPYYVTHPPSVVDYNDEYQGDDESNQIIQHVLRTESTPGKANVQCYNCNGKDMKMKAGCNQHIEENDFMLNTSYGEDLEELTTADMLMARLQLADDHARNVPSYDAKAVSQVHASSKVQEQVSHGKRKTVIQITDDDQIDSNIIFDDPFVENNGGTSEHDSIAHDEYHE